MIRNDLGSFTDTDQAGAPPAACGGRLKLPGRQSFREPSILALPEEKDDTKSAMAAYLRQFLYPYLRERAAPVPRKYSWVLPRGSW